MTWHSYIPSSALLLFNMDRFQSEADSTGRSTWEQIKYICVAFGSNRYFAQKIYWTDRKLISVWEVFCANCINHWMLYKKYVMALLQDNIFTVGVRKYLPEKKLFTWTTPILASELKARWPTDKTLTSLDLIQETFREKTFIQLVFWWTRKVALALSTFSELLLYHKSYPRNPPIENNHLAAALILMIIIDLWYGKIVKRNLIRAY